MGALLVSSGRDGEFVVMFYAVFHLLFSVLSVKLPLIYIAFISLRFLGKITNFETKSLLSLQRNIQPLSSTDNVLKLKVQL